MDMIALFRTLRKRWLLTTLLLLLTIAGAAALASRPGPYQAESQVTLLPSQVESAPAGHNPYLALNTSLTLTADLLRREVLDPRTARTLASRGYTAPYQIVDDPATAGPVLDITVTGPSQAAVQKTLLGVTAEVPVKLAQMQASVKPVNQITSLAVSVDRIPHLMTTKKLRLPVVAFALGMIFAAAIPQTVEAAAISRRARKAARPADERSPTAADGSNRGPVREPREPVRDSREPVRDPRDPWEPVRDPRGGGDPRGPGRDPLRAARDRSSEGQPNAGRPRDTRSHGESVPDQDETLSLRMSFGAGVAQDRLTGQTPQRPDAAEGNEGHT
jgi:hypothetical protein